MIFKRKYYKQNKNVDFDYKINENLVKEETENIKIKENLKLQKQIQKQYEEIKNEIKQVKDKKGIINKKFTEIEKKSKK